MCRGPAGWRFFLPAKLADQRQGDQSPRRLRRHNTLTVNAFDLATTLETGTVSSGWVTQHVRTFDAYGPATNTTSLLYALASHTLGSATYVLYDNESWAMTPSNEQADPGTYMADFVATAHANGLKAILAPSLDLTNKITACDVSSEPSWENYLTSCDLPALVGAAAPDVYSIQAQSLQNNTSSGSSCGCYQWFVDQSAAAAESAGPIGAVLAGLSTNPEGATTSGATMYADTEATIGAVSGYWLNVPQQSTSCPTCQPDGAPDVGVSYLALLGYTASGVQSITFSAPATAPFGSSATLTATGGNSGNPVTFSLDPSSGAGVCSLSGANGANVSFTSTGNCVIDADETGNSIFQAAPEVVQTISVQPLAQSISFTAPSSGSVGGQATLSATGGASGNPVVFSVDSTSGAGVCSLSGTNDSVVSYGAVGSCLIDANQAGNADYTAAAQVGQTISVGPGSQSITFLTTAPADASFGGSYSIQASGGGSGNPVVLSSATPAVCSVTDAGGTVSFVGVGTCMILADQAGGTNWTAAPEVSQSFSVAQAGQTITFTSSPPVSAVFGGGYTAAADGGGSGNPVVFSSGTPTVCSLSGATVAFVGVGTCTVLADQAGNANWTAAPEASQSFAVSPAGQAISFTSSPPLNAHFAGPVYSVSASGGGSGDPVIFSAATPTVCSVAGATVSFVGVGTCTIDADQAGNADYSAAPQVAQSFAVSQAPQTIKFTSTPPPHAKIGGSYTVTATGGGSGNAVVFSSATPAICTMKGSKVSFVGIGTCTVDANQAGNTDWLAAAQVAQSFTVARK